MACGGREVPRRSGPPLPHLSWSFLDKERPEGFGGGFRVFHFDTLRLWEGVSGFWDSWGIPAQNGPPECPVPVGKSDTVALRAHGPRGVYPYIFIISNFIIK